MYYDFSIEISKEIDKFKNDNSVLVNTLEKVNRYKEFGWRLFSENRKKEAEEFFIELIKLEKENVYLYIELFYLYKEQSKIDLMQECLSEAFRLNKDEVRCWEAKYYLKKIKKEPDLILYLLECIDKYPDKSTFYRELGVTYRDFGPEYGEKQYLDKAIGFLKKAKRIAKYENDYDGLILQNNDLGLVYEKKKDYKRALSFFSKSIEIINKFSKQNTIKDVERIKAWVYNTYFSICEKLNSINEQDRISYESAFEDAMKIYSNLDRYTIDSEYLDKENIGYIGLWYSRNNNYERAREYLEKAIKINEINPWNYINLAYTYYNPQKNVDIEKVEKDKINKCWEILKDLNKCVDSCLFQAYIDMVTIAEKMFSINDHSYKDELALILCKECHKKVLDFDEHIIVSDIFKITGNIRNDIDNKSETRYNLILLYKYIIDLKKKLKVTPDETKNGVVHYTIYKAINPCHSNSYQV